MEGSLKASVTTPVSLASPALLACRLFVEPEISLHYSFTF